MSEKLNYFSSAWDNVDPDRQTIDSLQEKLIKEEKRFEKEEAAVTNALSSSWKNRSPKYNSRQHPRHENRQTRNNSDEKEL